MNYYTAYDIPRPGEKYYIIEQLETAKDALSDSFVQLQVINRDKIPCDRDRLKDLLLEIEMMTENVVEQLSEDAKPYTISKTDNYNY